MWVAAEQAVAFAEVRPDNQVVLHLARGKRTPVEDISSDLQSPYVTTTPNGQEMTFISKSHPDKPQIVRVGKGQHITKSLPNHTLQETAPPGHTQLELWQAQRVAWNPDGIRAVFYNRDTIRLVNVQTAQNCAVSLGGDDRGHRWPLIMKWSPDGRFLSAETSIGGMKGKLPFTNITILDTLTGTLRQLTMDVHYVFEIEWLPNSRQMIALGHIGTDNSGYGVLGLYIVDVQSATFRRMLPSQIFRAGIGGDDDNGLDVSSDGKKIVAKCPVFGGKNLDMTEDRVCLIDIHVQQ